MTILATNRSSASISVERLRAAISYNPETGAFTWKVRPVVHFAGRADEQPADALCARWNGKFAGRPAFTCRDPRGYAKGMLDRVPLWAHRVAVAIVSGEWPDGEVDHVNRDKTDNRIANLRVVTHRENAANRVQGWGRGRRRAS
jgi:hypothetical protein